MSRRGLTARAERRMNRAPLFYYCKPCNAMHLQTKCPIKLAKKGQTKC